MSTSNDNRTVTYTGMQMLESALRQAGIRPAQFTAEMVATAFDVCNRMLIDFVNLGIQLWARDQVIMPLYLNRAQVQLPLGTSVVFDVRQRTLQRPTPISVVSETPDGGPGDGNASLAFDGDLSTACIQSEILGTLMADYGTPVAISNYGINFAVTDSFAWMIEYSLDNDLWVAIDAQSVDCEKGQWFWFDIDGAPAAQYWRLRSLNNPGAPLQVNELYFGNNPQEIPMGVWNVDDYDSMPIKNSPGDPWQYFQDRRLSTPTLIVWPVPTFTSIFMSLVARRRRYLNQLSDMQQTLDLSPRWYEFATTSLARRLCKELPEADMSRFQMLQSEELGALVLAQGEERDPAPERYQPGLEVYNF